MKKLWIFLIIMAMIVPNAVSADEYRYKVMIYGGDQGEFAQNISFDVDPESEIVISLKDNEGTYQLMVNGESYDLSLKDDRYEVLGLKETGYDNRQFLASSKVTVREDKKYVVYYGISGSLISYTVIYQTEDGTELGSDVYKGKVGDKPIVAAVAFDGYLPDAYNRTRTLTEDGDNTFIFTYHKVSTENITEEIEYVETQGQPAQAPAVQPSAEGNNAGTQSGDTIEVTEPAEPVEIIDEDVPLAAPDQIIGNTADSADQNEEMLSAHPASNPANRILLIATLIGQFAILLITIVALAMRKKRVYY